MVEHRLTTFLLVVGLLSFLSLAVRADDLIWYQPNNGYSGHQYAWRGTTDGNSAPELLIASFVNRPWLVTVSKTKNVIYWADNRGILGAWNISSKQQGLIYQFDIGNWDENSNGPALIGLDLDELNNHLYFTFNRSIYRLDLSQTTPAPSLIASYPNLVFNPRYSASRNSIYFCIRNNFNEQGDLVQVSLSDPSTMTTLVHNTSTGSIVQQLYIDDTTNTLYYNSPGTLTMRGVSLAAPYPQVFQSIYLGTNPTFFDFNPTTKAFVFSDLRFNRASLWPLGQESPTTIYQPFSGRVTGVKFYNDTHALVAFQNPSAGQGSLSLVNVNTFNDTSVLFQHFGLGKSLIFDEKKCDFYYVLSQQFSGQTYQSVMRKSIRDQEPSLYANEISVNGMMGGIALDVSKRNLIVSSTLNGSNTIVYFPIDNPNASPAQIVDSKGRSISDYVVNDKTGDIFYMSNKYIYRLDATSISKDWINNVGRRIIGPIKTVHAIHMAVDSAGMKFYYSVDSSIMQSNFDGSDIKTFFTVPGKQSGIRSMKWDPRSKRLYFIATPQSGWIMASVNDDGTNLISVSLNASSSSTQDLFSHINPDPHSEWVYMKAKYYQPLRIKKDGSQVEILNLYSPLHYQVGSMAFDETTSSIYYNDDQCVIKSINISNVNLNDPNTTPFAVTWQGDTSKCSDVSFIHDRANRQLWLLQSNQGKNYSVAVTPVNGGPTKPLFAFPKNVNPPFAIDTTSSKMFAFYFTLDRRGYPTDQSLVTMDLYNGSNMRIVKKFDRMTMTAVTFDSRTNMIYYGLDSYGETVLECFDPVTLTVKRLWYLPNKRYFIRDLKVKDGSVYMAMWYGNMFVYDLKNGTATDQLAYATALSLNPNNNDIYFAPPYAISSANVQSVNATQITLLKAFTIEDLVFDFENRYAYFTIAPSSIGTEPPYYYRMDLDGSNKKRMQLQRSFYVPAVLKQLSLVNGKFYAANGYLDSFNMDGTDYNRIMQSTEVRGDVQYDEASQRIYWQESYGRSCAVYSNKYADCRGYQLFSEMQYTSLGMPQLRDFVIGKNGMIYFTAFYQKAIFQMNLDVGVSSMKILVSDPRLAYVSGITTDKLKSALYVTTAYPTISPAILRVGFDGTITTLYSNVPLSESILSTDLTHCTN